MKQENLLPGDQSTPRETRSANYAARFPPTLKRRAMEIASAKGRSFNDLLIEALENAITRDGQGARAA